MKVLEVDQTTGTIKFQFKDNIMTFIMDFKEADMPKDEGLIATILINTIVYFKKHMCCDVHFIEAIEAAVNMALKVEHKMKCEANA